MLTLSFTGEFPTHIDFRTERLVDLRFVSLMVMKVFFPPGEIGLGGGALLRLRSPSTGANLTCLLDLAFLFEVLQLQTGLPFSGCFFAVTLMVVLVFVVFVVFVVSFGVT